MCKEKYVKPEINLLTFEQDDVVRTSDGKTDPYETKDDDF